MFSKNFNTTSVLVWCEITIGVTVKLLYLFIFNTLKINYDISPYNAIGDYPSDSEVLRQLFLTNNFQTNKKMNSLL